MLHDCSAAAGPRGSRNWRPRSAGFVSSRHAAHLFEMRLDDAGLDVSLDDIDSVFVTARTKDIGSDILARWMSAQT